MQKPQFLIGASSSGSGKTTFTLGLLRALRNRGLHVQPFKCGPDYLDTKHHAVAAGQESYNLDIFMSSSQHIRDIYSRQAEPADVCITEGVMGLFDGYNHMQGSSAEIAEILQLPVILIVNARSTAYTVAAILYGFKHFRPHLQIAGVVFNFVGSASHYAYLQQACEDAGVEALGYLPRSSSIEIPSRHLGLNIDNEFCFDEFANRIAEQLEQTVDIEKILAITSNRQIPFLQPVNNDPDTGKQTISVAYDEAFNFIYPENIRALKAIGKVNFFSPLADHALPPSDLVYLPGGYPELFLPQLSSNTSMLRSIAAYCKEGGRLLAECGGMMYLGQYITHTDGTPYPMCGYLPHGATMENMKLYLGYRKAIIQGKEYYGHEFHYSHLIPGKHPLTSVAKVYNAKGEETDTAIYRQGNTIASYIHFYWAENRNFPFYSFQMQV